MRKKSERIKYSGRKTIVVVEQPQSESQRENKVVHGSHPDMIEA
jgi:hypothetical protein